MASRDHSEEALPGARGRVATALALLVAALAVYSNSFDVPFQFDDVANIVLNPAIHDLSSFLHTDEVAQRLSQGQAVNAFGRYLGGLSFALNHRVHGLDVWGYHAVNLAIHVVSSWLAWLLAAEILAAPSLRGRIPHSTWVAAGVGLFFAVHPLQTQAVTYIVQRFASMATMFYLGAALFYLKARATEGSKAWLVGAVILTALAMKTKETAFTIPVVLCGLEWALFSGPTRARLLRLAWFAPTLAIIPCTLLLSARAWGPDGNASAEESGPSSLVYLLSELPVWFQYGRMLLLPYGQTINHPSVWRAGLDAQVAASGLVLVGVAAGAIVAALRGQGPTRLVGVGLAWFMATLSIESTFVPLSSTIYEHRLYLPSFGFFLAAGAAISALAQRWGRPRWVGASVVVWAVILGSLAHARNEVWRDPIELWREAVALAPEDPRPLNNLATSLAELGDDEAAVEFFGKALALEPDQELAQLGLAKSLARLGRNDEAAEHFARASALGLGAEVALSRGALAFEQARPQEAVSFFVQAAALDPNNAQVHWNLGFALHQLGDCARAMPSLEQAWLLDPTVGRSRLLRASCLASSGDYAAAGPLFEAERRAHPGDASVLAYQGLALGESGRLDEAIALLVEATRMDPGLGVAFSNLGTALFVAGDLEGARAALEQALQLDPKDARSHYNLGLLLDRLGEPEAAREHRQAAATLSPGLGE